MSFYSVSGRQYVLSALILLTFALPVHADIPKIISYQGKVTDCGGTPVADGAYSMQFRIYDDPTGGDLLWDSTHPSVQVTDGIFSVLLGENTTLSLPFDEDYWLLVTFAGVNQIPRQRLASAGYAYMASGLVPGTEVSGAVISETYAAIKGVNTATTGRSRSRDHSFGTGKRSI